MDIKQRPVLGTIFFAVVVLAIVLGGFYWFSSRPVRNGPYTHNRNVLKQFAIAMHNFAEEHGTFPPPAIHSKNGKPLLSWRVAILPYIEEDELYKRFHLDEPWDSPHNLSLLKQMPAIYRDARDDDRVPTETTYWRVFVGPGAVFEGPRGISLKEIVEADGTSNTLLIVEAAEAVPWTKPAELAYSPECSLPSLGRDPKAFLAAFADCTVRSVPKDCPEEQLRAAITRNGGEVLSLP